VVGAPDGQAGDASSYQSLGLPVGSDLGWVSRHFSEPGIRVGDTLVVHEVTGANEATEPFEVWACYDQGTVLEEAHIRADLSPDGTRLTGGVIGGAIGLTELLEALASAPEAAEYLDVMQAMLPQLADLDLDEGWRVAADSPAAGAGVAWPSVRGDHDGSCRADPPTVGAFGALP